MTKTMAEVLAEHVSPEDIEGYRGTRCPCGRWFDTDDEHVTHVASALTAAGFGLVADAKAEALEEAAGALDDLWKWRRARFDRDWADGVEESETLLRAHAAELRQP